jgi:hypothetical protein
MKRLLFLIGLALACSMVYGQVGGAVYRPIIYEPPRQQQAPPPTTINYYSVTPRTTQPANRIYIVDEKAFVVEAYSTKYDRMYDLQIKETSYSDGSLYQTVVGIKINNTWKSVSCEVGYIAEMLSAPNLTKEMRETLLLCNEYATHLIAYNDDILLIGLRK